MMKDGTLLSGGGKDRKIVQWDSNYKRAGVETEVCLFLVFYIHLWEVEFFLRQLTPKSVIYLCIYLIGILHDA